MHSQKAVLMPESFIVNPHRLCWQAGFTCSGLCAQSGSMLKPISIIRTLASFPPSPDLVGRCWLQGSPFSARTLASYSFFHD